MSTLLEHLRLGKDSTCLIIACNQLGVAHSYNAAISNCFQEGSVTTAALQVPSPWARNAAATYQGQDVGIALTCNAEYEAYRWGPVTMSPSLFDGDGGFPRTLTDFWEHADVDEVRRECRAQIERAILWGFDLSHLRSHLDALSLRPEFFDVFLELAIEFDVPLSLADQNVDLGFPARKLAEEEGILSPDYSFMLSAPSTEYFLAELDDLPIGVTEIRCSPAIESAELKAFNPDWQQSKDHFSLLKKLDIKKECQKRDIRLIGFQEIKKAQRKK